MGPQRFLSRYRFVVQLKLYADCMPEHLSFKKHIAREQTRWIPNDIPSESTQHDWSRSPQNPTSSSMNLTARLNNRVLHTTKYFHISKRELEVASKLLCNASCAYTYRSFRGGFGRQHSVVCAQSLGCGTHCVNLWSAYNTQVLHLTCSCRLLDGDLRSKHAIHIQGDENFCRHCGRHTRVYER